MFHFGRFPSTCLSFSACDLQASPAWVSPFGHPRLSAHLQLPAAFRSLSRPSSAPGALASALCSFFLDFARRPFRRLSFVPFPLLVISFPLPLDVSDRCPLLTNHFVSLSSAVCFFLFPIVPNLSQTSASAAFFALSFVQFSRCIQYKDWLSIPAWWR